MPAREAPSAAPLDEPARSVEPQPGVSPPLPRWSRDPMLLGTICGLLAALIYTCSNICLRQAAHRCDPIWVACMKAVPTFVVASLILGWHRWKGEALQVPRRVIFGLVATGLIGQIFGNVGFQCSLPIVGLGLAVSLTLGSTIIGGALLGRFWLGESMPARSWLATLTLLVAVPVLALGAEQSGPAESLASSWSSVWLVAAGVASACVAGLAYSLQSGVLRKMATGPIPNSFTLLMLSGTGIVVLGAISLGRLGVEGLRSTRPDDLLIMIWGGLFNALAFFLLTKALELISMVMVNAITASQAAMAAVAGVLFFSESITWPLATGVGLTIAGLLLMDRRGHVAIDDAP